MNELINSKRVIFYFAVLWMILFGVLFSVGGTTGIVIMTFLLLLPGKLCMVFSSSCFVSAGLFGFPGPAAIILTIIYDIILFYLLSKLTVLILKTFVNKNKMNSGD
jgi:hypothetical protein